MILIDTKYLRRRVPFILERLSARHVQISAAWWSRIFDWLEKYARHEPDLCDAMLVVAAAREKCSIWTYDTEFQKLWRSPEGRLLPLIGSSPKASRRKPTKRRAEP